MKVSKIPFKSSKTRGGEEFNSVEILFQSGQLKRFAAGIYGYGFLLARAIRKAEDLTRKYLDKYGCIEVMLPLLQPKSVWQESGRWEKYKQSDTTYYSKGRDNEYFIAPTAEECMVQLMKSNINSYKDLNFNVYQIGRKFRDEIRPRGGMLRGREFSMHDGYSFHDTREAMEAEYIKMKQCYYELFKAFGLETVAVRAVNDYGGKISEEIMCFSPIGEDKVLYNASTGLVLNQEVLDSEELRNDIIKEFGNVDFSKMEKRQAIEIGHIFHLDQFYAKSMNITFTNNQGKVDYCYMGTYGFSPTRALNVVLEHNSDENGLVYPLNLAPYKLGIINLNNKAEAAEELYNYFENKGIETLWDDRNISLGFKLNDMLLNGIPYIVIIGNNSNNEVLEVENRKTREKLHLTKEKLVKLVK